MRVSTGVEKKYMIGEGEGKLLYFLLCKYSYLVFITCGRYCTNCLTFVVRFKMRSFNHVGH